MKITKTQIYSIYGQIATAAGAAWLVAWPDSFIANVFRFVTGAALIVIFLGWVMVGGIRSPKNAPAIVDHVTYCITICLLSGFKHYWLATAWLIVYLIDRFAPERAKDEVENKIKNQDQEA